MRPNRRSYRREPVQLPARERGVVLMIALIVLVALTLAGLSMVRSSDTGSVIAGNLGFRQASALATDVSVEQAYSDLTNIYTKLPDTSVANKYLSSSKSLATDANGIPTGAPVYTSWPTVAGVALPSGFTARYFVERLCVGDGVTPISDLAGKCLTETAGEAQGGSQKVGSPVFTGQVKINYRVTVRVDGPRNSLSIAQTVFAY